MNELDYKLYFPERKTVKLKNQGFWYFSVKPSGTWSAKTDYVMFSYETKYQVRHALQGARNYILDLSTTQTLTAASLQTSHAGTSLVRNQLRRSRKDLTPSPIFSSSVKHSHLSCISCSSVFSFWAMEKFLNAGGTWVWPPCDCESVPLGTWKLDNKGLPTKQIAIKSWTTLLQYSLYWPNKSQW